MGDRTSSAHCHLKGHLFKMGLTDSPTCERCLEKDETAIAYLRFRHLVHYFMEPGDYQDAPVRKILHFIGSVGLLEGWNRGGCTIDLGKIAVQGPIKAYPLFIHSFIHTSPCLFTGCFVWSRRYVRNCCWTTISCGHGYSKPMAYSTDARICNSSDSWLPSQWIDK
jgi:hypothetical protein